MGKWSPQYLPLIHRPTGTVVNITMLDTDGDPDTAQAVLAGLVDTCIGRPVDTYQAAIHKLDEQAERAHKARLAAPAHNNGAWSGL